jgi:hypothetical protein
MRLYACAVVVLIAVSTVALAQCSANGLTLSHQGVRLGDPFSVTLSGTPGASGLLGVDVAPGTLSTPIGTVCLGLTPALQLLPFALDPAGHFALGGILPPQPGLIGLSAFLQAAAIDPTQPSGSALSNSASLTLRSPRVFFIDKGSTGQPGSWCSYDALTDTVLVGPVTLPGIVSDVVLVPSLGWIVFDINNGVTYTLHCYAAATGAQTASIPLPWSGFRMALDGNTLYFTVGAGIGQPGALASMSLPSGTPGLFTTLAPSPSGYPPQAIIIPPGSGHAYLRFLDRVSAVNVATGVELPPINVGGPGAIEEWLLEGTTLYTLVYGSLFGGGGPVIDAIDTTTHLALHPTPVALPIPAPVTSLRYGPGQFGNTLFVQNQNLVPALFQLDPATLLPINQVSGIPAGENEMVLSPGGTEWLIRTCGGPPVFACSNSWLLSLQIPSMTVSIINPVINPAQRLTSIQSATLRRAFWVSNLNTVVPFTTDPATPPTGTVTLPIWSTNLRVLID